MTYESEIRADREEPVAMVIDGDAVPSEEEAKSKRKTMIIAIALIIAAIAAAAFLMSGSDAPPPQERALPTITVISPGRATVEGEISATGTLAARRSMPVGVVGEGGRVLSVAVDAGSWVRQGQVLAVIDRSVQSQQAVSAAAQVQVAQADANLAQANLDRALQLVERGFVSTADVDRLTATRDSAAARVRVSQAQLRELQARNARLNILAPSAGLVLERNVEPGQTVSAGTPALFVIARGGEMEMLAQLGETELASITAGAVATVTPVGADKSFAGQIWQVAPTINAQTRQGTARIALSYDPALKPGGFASAQISAGTVVAPVLPESAIQSYDGQSYVFIANAEDKVERRDVKTGMISDSGIVITEGLTGQERVVLRAAGFLREGQEIAPKLQNVVGE